MSELQTTSGERSFTLESEALTNIANNGRMLFNFATLVPGALQQGTAGAEIGAADGFTVNGQRPNSNNMTIDGVANIDTGNNGGNMATTNIDAVAEFKILTNAYQAEYGRAVGGQVQVVTKSGSQELPRLGLLVRPALGLERQHLVEQARGTAAVGAVQPAKTSRNDCGYTLGGPIFIPGLQRGQEEAVLLLQPGVPEPHGPGERAAGPRAHRPRAGGDFSQSVDTSGNPFPYIRDYSSSGPVLQRATDTRGCFRTAACSAGSPRAVSMRPGWRFSTSTPQANFSGGSGINFTSQDPEQLAAP